VHRRQRETQRRLEGRAGRGLLLEGDHDAVDAALARPTRPAEGHVEPHAGLQFERDVLDDVGEVRATAQPLDEAARPSDATLVFLNTRQPLHQAIHESGEAVARAILVRPHVNNNLEHRYVRVQIGAA
jgi:hypothetical protein